jgi:hypothetical protein
VEGITFESVPSKFSLGRVMTSVAINGQITTTFDVSLSQCNISFVDTVNANGTVPMPLARSSDLVSCRVVCRLMLT